MCVGMLTIIASLSDWYCRKAFRCVDGDSIASHFISGRKPDRQSMPDAAAPGESSGALSGIFRLSHLSSLSYCWWPVDGNVVGARLLRPVPIMPPLDVWKKF